MYIYIYIWRSLYMCTYIDMYKYVFLNTYIYIHINVYNISSDRRREACVDRDLFLSLCLHWCTGVELAHASLAVQIQWLAVCPARYRESEYHIRMSACLCTFWFVRGPPEGYILGLALRLGKPIGSVTVGAALWTGRQPSVQGRGGAARTALLGPPPPLRGPGLDAVGPGRERGWG